MIADIAVIGLGMFGASAAKYLSQAGADVIAIGPEEPHASDAPDLARFAAHYDEGRICRRLGWDPVWANLDATSLARFRQIEDQSGIPFFTDHGSLILLAHSIRSRTDTIVRQANDDHIPVERLTAHELQRQFPMITPPALTGGTEALWEREGAGILNPRRFVAAQVSLAQSAGARVLRGIVTRTEQLDGLWRVHTAVGAQKQIVTAREVLIATGALTNQVGVLPAEFHLAMRSYTEPNLRFEVDMRRSADLWELPPIVVVDPDDVGCENKSTYVIPPVLYPDGKHYMRIGPGMQPFITELSSTIEVLDWYHGQTITDPQRSFLAKEMTELVPSSRAFPTTEATCVIEKTVSGYPYLGRLSDTLTVAVGGNGHGARGADEIGRVASTLALGTTYDSLIPEETFTPQLTCRQPAPWRASQKLKPPFGLC